MKITTLFVSSEKTKRLKKVSLHPNRTKTWLTVRADPQFLTKKIALEARAPKVKSKKKKKDKQREKPLSQLRIRMQLKKQTKHPHPLLNPSRKRTSRRMTKRRLPKPLWTSKL